MIPHGPLHRAILVHILEKGYAPEVDDLVQVFHSTPEEIISSLRSLHEYHGVVLHPHEPRIWVIHPFALAATNFYVQSERGSWWGNCAWCSLGIAALLDEDVTITTSFGAHGEKALIHIHTGKVLEKSLLVHFPVPMKKAWDNVIYTCTTMLVFRNEGEIDQWCSQHDIPKGDVQPIDTVWAFAEKWYGNHLNPEWKKWTMAEAREIFDSFGFTHPVWDLSPGGERF